MLLLVDYRQQAVMHVRKTG